MALTYNAGMEQILVLMPGIIAAMQTMVNQGAMTSRPPPRSITMSLPICTTGYVPATQQAHRRRRRYHPHPDGQFCSIPQNPRRGARRPTCPAWSARQRAPLRGVPRRPYVPAPAAADTGFA